MLHRRLCAVALATTAAIHLVVVPEHQREWPAAAAFFITLAAVELALAVVVLRRPNRRLLILGAAASIGSGLLWLVSRTVGLPFGPEPFVPERMATLDVLSTALELVSAAILFHLAVRAPTGRSTHVSA